MKGTVHEEDCTQKDYTQRGLYMKGTAEHMLKTHSTERGLYSREAKE